MKGIIFFVAITFCYMTSNIVIANSGIQHLIPSVSEKKDWELNEINNYSYIQLNEYLTFAIANDLNNEFELVLTKINQQQYNQFYLISNILFSGEIGREKYAYKLINHLKDIDSNIAMQGSDTLLHYFSNKGSLEIVKYLLESGANPDLRDSFNNKPLDKAAMTDDIEMYRLILPYTDLTTSIKTPYGDWYYYQSLSDLLLFGNKINRKEMFSLLINNNDFPKDYLTLANLRMKLYKNDQSDILPIIDPHIKALGYTPVP
jgi:ankyrin repeat protein